MAGRKRTRDHSDRESQSSNENQMTPMDVVSTQQIWDVLNTNRETVKVVLEEMTIEIKQGICYGIEVDDSAWENFSMKVAGYQHKYIRVLRELCVALLNMFRAFNVLVEDVSCKVNESYFVKAEPHVWKRIAKESQRSLYFKDKPCLIFDLLKDSFSSFESTRVREVNRQILNTNLSARKIQADCASIAETNVKPKRFLAALGRLNPSFDFDSLISVAFIFLPGKVQKYWVKKLPVSSESESESSE